MDKLRELNRSKKLIAAFCGLLFLFMLAMNYLTPYVADDYTYMYSFADGQRLAGVGDVFRSIYRHSFTMNGRAVSHFFGQLFMLYPRVVFDACNAAVYVALMALMYRAVNYRREENLLLFVGMCAGFWYFLPAFGQVALWQMGSVNYLWGLLGGMVYILPFFERAVCGREPLPRLWQKLLFCVFALPFGMYTEVTSFIGLFLAVLFLAWVPVTKQGRWKSWLWLPAALTGLGYVLLMLMPAELAAKQTEMNLPVLLFNVARSTMVLRDEGLWLLLAWVVTFILACYARLPADRLGVSLIFAVGALGANYMLVMASYYESRCFCTTAMLLVMAVAVLVPDLMRTRMQVVCTCGAGVLAAVFFISLIIGAADIGQSYWEFSQRENTIYEQIAAGETDLTATVVRGRTKYSAFQWLKDMDTENPKSWPNRHMAKYYGVNSILGVPEADESN